MSGKTISFRVGATDGRQQHRSKPEQNPLYHKQLFAKTPCRIQQLNKRPSEAGWLSTNNMACEDQNVMSALSVAVILRQHEHTFNL